MLDFLQKYTGTIKLNNKEINNAEFSSILNKTNGEVQILLIPKNTIDCSNQINKNSAAFVSVLVKPWMLEKSSADFMFMSTWNKDIPMPLRYMVGTLEKETSRMYYMKLRGEPKNSLVCSKCGRTLVNPISKLFGIGPECSNKVGLDTRLFISEQAAKEQLNKIEDTIKNIRWEGWIPKTAILELKNYNANT